MGSAQARSYLASTIKKHTIEWCILKNEDFIISICPYAHVHSYGFIQHEETVSSIWMR